MEQTFGEKLVRASFNPSTDSAVDRIKAEIASVITLLDELRRQSPVGTFEPGRCYGIAITHLEAAAMFAVKAATTGK